MSCRKRRRWHFRDPKFSYFLLGEYAPRLHQVWAVTFIPLRAPSKSHVLRCQLRYLIAYQINAQGWKKRLGLEGVGVGEAF